MTRSDTKQRILDGALALFNVHGATAVSTNHIADELNISPGNLYYHFRSRDDIVDALFHRFEAEIDCVLQPPDLPVADPAGTWIYLHLVFETIARYRFIYWELNRLLSGNAFWRRRFRHVMDRKVVTSRAYCQGLKTAGYLNATDEEIDSLAENIALITTFWLNFEYVRGVTSLDEAAINQGIRQVFALVASWLTPDARDYLETLSRQYRESPPAVPGDEAEGRQRF
ncbi:TetR/AcrR family transcriptional regulator [Saccharospirillum salsuginis]|uniref:TetR family transcriptional regulator n=1 Tax=Saccharospirillum salsuginis TaxID=418750 RepID=A0A918K6R3_9GAMM|nr:TetR/AcrR family transcriptional regulator [Saccharospirillum salsuginis]GGX52413.1 TetR family transcriptional regulator [Saccharospirillum salsuginis]